MPSYTKKRIPTAIVSRMRHLGLSDLMMQERLNVQQNQFNCWKNGRVEPTVRNAIRIAKALGCTVEELWPEVPA